jgi:hypothetical protein
MNRLIKAIVAASLLVLSGNAAAILMNDQIYGSSGYSLHDIDVAIQAFKDDISGKKDRKRLKKAYKLDRKVERLVYKVDSAIVSGNDRKLRKKNKKLIKKEAKLLAILAAYLPNLDELLQNGNLLMISDILPAGDLPLPPLDISQLDRDTLKRNRIRTGSFDVCIARPGICVLDVCWTQREAVADVTRGGATTVTFVQASPLHKKLI